MKSESAKGEGRKAKVEVPPQNNSNSFSTYILYFFIFNSLISDLPHMAYNKKKTKRTVTAGRAYIGATYNNTLVTITDENGNVLTWSTSGASGFKGSRKSTPYAAQVAAQNAAEKAKTTYGLSEVAVYVKGVGSGREQAIRALQTAGLNVSSINDVTAIPHGGCRPKKARRV